MCIVACLGIACLSAIHLRANPVAVQSMEDLQRINATAKQQNHLVVLLFIASSSSDGKSALLASKSIQNQSFMDWVERHAELGVVDVSAGETPVQDGRDTLRFMHPQVSKVVRATHMRDVPWLALYDDEGVLLEWTTGGTETPELIEKFQKCYRKVFKGIKEAPDAPPTAPPPPALKLKMISGTAQRRLATINDETFFAGETHRVSVNNQNLRVQCVEIREKSVLVKINDETQSFELTIGESHPVAAASLEPSPQDQFNRGANDALRNPVFRRIFAAIGWSIIVLSLAMLGLYVPFCWSCFQLCRRAGYPSMILVWLPGFKRLALYRATDTAWFWFFFPLFCWSACRQRIVTHDPNVDFAVWLMFFLLALSGAFAWIRCCARLCSLFNKTRWWVLLMIWPVIGWPVFMYLAWSSRAEDNEPAIRAMDRGFESARLTSANLPS